MHGCFSLSATIECLLRKDIIVLKMLPTVVTGLASVNTPQWMATIHKFCSVCLYFFGGFCVLCLSGNEWCSRKIISKMNTTVDWSTPFMLVAIAQADYRNEIPGVRHTNKENQNEKKTTDFRTNGNMKNRIVFVGICFCVNEWKPLLRLHCLVDLFEQRKLNIFNRDFDRKINDIFECTFIGGHKHVSMRQ